MLGHWKVARTVFVKLSSSWNKEFNNKRKKKESDGYEMKCCDNNNHHYITNLVDVDASAANAQPNSSGVRLLLLLVELLDGVLVGRARAMRRPFQCPAIGVIGGRRKSRFHFPVELVLLGSVERDAGPIGQAAITSGSFRTPQSVVMLQLVVIVRFLRTSQPVKMQTVMRVTAGRLLNVKELGRTGRQATVISMHGRHILNNVIHSHSLEDLHRRGILLFLKNAEMVVKSLEEKEKKS